MRCKTVFQSERDIKREVVFPATSLKSSSSPIISRSFLLGGAVCVCAPFCCRSTERYQAKYGDLVRLVCPETDNPFGAGGEGE